MSLYHLADYFDIGPHSRRWNQSDLDGWQRHYNTHNAIRVEV
jgi:hypothetical protein